MFPVFKFILSLLLLILWRFKEVYTFFCQRLYMKSILFCILCYICIIFMDLGVYCKNNVTVENTVYSNYSICLCETFADFIGIVSDYSLGKKKKKKRTVFFHQLEAHLNICKAGHVMNQSNKEITHSPCLMTCNKILLQS